MKVNPNSNFPVRVYPEETWELDESIRHLYRGIYSLTLNHSEEVYMMPPFDLSDLDCSVMPATDMDFQTESQARVAVAAGSYVVSPSETKAGQDMALPLLNIGELDFPYYDDRFRFEAEHVIIFYVSPEEYERMDSEAAHIVKVGYYGEIAAEEDPVANQLVERFGVPVDDIQHLAIGRFLKGRFISSALVEAPMLGKPGNPPT